MKTYFPLYRKQKYLLPAGFVVLFAAFGVVLLFQSHAASPYASIEAETGTIADGATSVTDSKASAGSYLQFGSTAGSVLWNGDFSTGDTSQYNYTQLCTDDPNNVVNSPTRSGSAYAIRFSVRNDDVGPGLGGTTTNPICPNNGSDQPAEAVLETNAFHLGDDRYIGFSAMFPTGFPNIPSTGGTFFQVSELFGSPFTGSPPVEVDVVGQSLALVTNLSSNTYPNCSGNSQAYKIAWTGPTFSYNQWNDIVLHVVFGDSTSTGSVQLWYNGVPQTFSNGSTTLNIAVLDPCVNYDESTNSADSLYIDQYRSASLATGSNPITSYMDDAKIGTSYSAVAP